MFGSVLGALGNKIKGVMASELSALKSKAGIMTVGAPGIPSGRQCLQRARVW